MNKKGQSLVEVVVALGILAFVFAGTITLIVQIVSLQLATRNRTEAVALAQKTMAETVSTLTDGCGNISSTNTTGSSGNFTYSVQVSNADAYPDGGSSTSSRDVDLDGNQFYQVLVSVTWDDRDYVGNNYELKQIVKK